MNFTFPEDKTLYYGKLKKISTYGKFTKFLDIDISKPQQNLITIDKIDYYFTYLTDNSGNKGGNSVILRLYVAEEFDTDNINYGTPDLIIKILKFPSQFIPSKSAKRFLKEIEALKTCKASKFENIIDIVHDGVCKIFDAQKDRFLEYHFYTMEYARFDLKSFIEENHAALSTEQKVSLCLSLCEGLKELRTLGYFHRDIKPDNIFLTDYNVWKIGDLGLLDDRSTLYNELDEIAEAIGPRGWMSPESMNKYLCEEKGFSFKHNCKIDHQSDIFQLGKVFWYIFQHNAPIGSVKESDFVNGYTQIYPIIKTMLNHSKKRRFKDIRDVIDLLKPLEVRILKSAV